MELADNNNGDNNDEDKDDDNCIEFAVDNSIVVSETAQIANQVSETC